ncbi:uncharacterized protein LOC121368937 isoform X3 [Gigantopelta aegis]|uniref:uncharacterized protein LOC121368937 isoform X3 n=1 Tax=Gigantopelta aegis TaxID=1735272 RepID=UPI001B887673|nr:uncharacterized protein LOC121368937 isoform X3 [Gigantopelta aegis]
MRIFHVEGPVESSVSWNASGSSRRWDDGRIPHSNRMTRDKMNQISEQEDSTPSDSPANALQGESLPSSVVMATMHDDRLSPSQESVARVTLHGNRLTPPELSPTTSLAELEALWDGFPYIDDSDADNTQTHVRTDTEDAGGRHGSQLCRSRSRGMCQLPPSYFFLFLSVLAVIAVCSVNPSHSKHVLKVGVPAHIKLRKVRMYSVEPDLTDFSAQNSSYALVSRLQLLDYSSCQGNLSACETFALCDAVDSMLSCRCKRGFYLEGLQCTACRTSCSEGHFMTSQCSAGHDVVCTPCTQCRGTTYEAAPCTSTQDTICVEVSFPVGILPTNASVLLDDGTSLGVETSDNVFMERLRDMRELEESMYVTNHQQAMNFVWHRDSGLEIKISVTGVYLVPEYVDIDHVGDNPFYMHSHNITNKQKKRFKTITEKYCRNPLPDYYSLHLDIVRDRTSTADLIRCDSQNASVPKCPSHYKDGDKFLLRHINTPCPKFQINSHRSKSLPKLEDLSNSVVCPGESGLARLLGIPNPSVQRLTFPSEECKFHLEQCTDCLAKNTCTNHSADAPVHRECCNVNCYKHPTCTQAFSSTCPDMQVECASGDIYVFTLSPVFESMKTRFMCHVQYEKPSHLYNVEYAVRIPNLNYVIERNFTISSHDLASHRSMKSQLDFLSVFHDTWFPLEDEAVLVGRHHQVFEQMGEFSIHSLKEADDFFPHHYAVRQDMPTRFSTLIQFDRPFRYSALSFINGGCEKNVSQVFPNQTIYRSESVPVTAKFLKENGEIHYQLYRTDRSPFIRLYINKSEPVLSVFQANLVGNRIDSASLHANITWNSKMRVWKLTVSGLLSGCPGILAIRIFDKLQSQCLGHFEAFVNCPKRFTLRFNISDSKPQLPDIFVVYVNDSSTSHRLFLTSVIVPENMAAMTSDAGGITDTWESDTFSPWIPIILTISLSIMMLVVLFVVYLCFTLSTPKYMDEMTDKPESAMLNNLDRPQESVKKTQKKGASKILICWLVVLYVIYSIVFTFSLAFGLLYFTHMSMFSNYSGIVNLTSQLQNQMNVSLQHMKEFEQEQITLMINVFKQRQMACTHHLNMENRQIVNEHIKIMEKQLAVIYVANGSLRYMAENLMEEKSSKHVKKVEAFFRECNQTVEEYFHRFSENYYNYLKEVVHNGWFDFPREMFSKQNSRDKTVELSMPHLLKFLSWLQIDRADNLMSVGNKISERLTKESPYVFSLFSSLDLRQPAHVEIPTITIKNSHTIRYKHLILPRPKWKPTEKNTQRTNQREVTIKKTNEKDADLSLSSDCEIALYGLIAVFVLLDVFLWVYRFTWLYKEVQEALQGREEPIPTDNISRKVLKIQTGQHPPRVSESYDQQYNCIQNSENMRWNSDHELYVYFCQSYPKSKEDILREIWSHKMNQKPKVSKEKFRLWPVKNILHCCWWIHRALLSKLLWRFTHSCVVVILLCYLVYLLQYWLDEGNVEVLLGADLLLLELQWQAAVVNRYLAASASHLNGLLDNLATFVHREVGESNTFMYATMQRQSDLLLSVMSELCNNTSNVACDLGEIRMPSLSPLTPCNFLPIQHHIFDDFDFSNISSLISQELSPLLNTARSLCFNTACVIILFVCARIVCHVTARIVKDYLLVTGRLPQIIIYQISNGVGVMADAGVEPVAEIHRSGSWLESCESGVYVGENDDSARESTI